MATICTNNKQDSNFTGLSIAEEVCLGVLPDVGNGDPSDPVWYGREPNSYGDFGFENVTETRSPIEPSRQNAKGTIVDGNGSGQWNEDIALTNLPRILQGFFFADAHEKPSTAAYNKSAIAVSSVTAATHKFNTSSTAAAAGNSFNVAGLLVLSKNFGLAANNVLGVVASADVDDITIAAGLADEATPPDNATVEVVGYEFGTADAGITKTGNQLFLTSAADVLDTLGLNVGEWIYIGGDGAANADSFVNNKGFARIGTIDSGTIALDIATFAGATEASAGKKIRIFFGKFLRNENDPTLIKRRSYQLERTLGNGPTSVQAEYLEGSVANELKVNYPTGKKLTVDLGFVATRYSLRTGEAGDEIKDGSRVAAGGEDAFNNANDIYQSKIYLIDPSTAAPSSFFAFATDSNITIANGVTPNKASGVLGAFDVSTGNFVVSGSIEAYFATVSAIAAIQANSDVGYYSIAAKQNTGFIFDLPLLGLGGGKVTIEKDNPIKIPVTPQAAKCKNGYTASYTFFPYLPDAAMPQ